MKARMFLAAIFVLTVWVAAPGQTRYVGSGQATLQSRTMDKETGADNYVDAAYSFEKASNGSASLTTTKNDWDLLFSSLRRPDGTVIRDVFDVTMVVDDRSRILDLGEHELIEPIVIPDLPAFRTPTREKSVDARLGHLYLVHTADSNSDLYTVFHVDELTSGRSVVISWKLIAPPGK